MSVRPFIIFNFFDNNFSCDVYSSVFWNTESSNNKVQCYKRSISLIKSYKCKYVLNSNKFTYNYVYTFIFCLLSSDTLQEMFVYPTFLF